MNVENRFVTAGWVSVATAAVFVVSWVFAIIEDSMDLMGVVDRPINIGVSDFLFLLFAAMSIYVLVSLKSLLFERYSSRDLNLVIWITVVWHIVFYGGSFIGEAIVAAAVPDDSVYDAWFMWVFWTAGVAVFGILDIIIAFLLLRDRTRFGTALTVFAILNLILGVVEATVLLSLLSLALAPLSYLALAYVFLAKQETLEFV